VLHPPLPSQHFRFGPWPNYESQLAAQRNRAERWDQSLKDPNDRQPAHYGVRI